MKSKTARGMRSNQRVVDTTSQIYDNVSVAPDLSASSTCCLSMMGVSALCFFAGLRDGVDGSAMYVVLVPGFRLLAPTARADPAELGGTGVAEERRRVL